MGRWGSREWVRPHVPTVLNPKPACSQTGAEASAPLGAIEPPGPLLGHTQALKASGSPEGLGLIPDLHREGRSVRAWPRLLVPWCGASAASRLGTLGEMNHLLPWLGAAHCLHCSRAPGRILPPHPSCACYLCPTEAPGQRR